MGGSFRSPFDARRVIAVFFPIHAISCKTVHSLTTKEVQVLTSQRKALLLERLLQDVR